MPTCHLGKFDSAPDLSNQSINQYITHFLTKQGVTDACCKFKHRTQIRYATKQRHWPFSRRNMISETFQNIPKVSESFGDRLLDYIHNFYLWSWSSNVILVVILPVRERGESWTAGEVRQLQYLTNRLEKPHLFRMYQHGSSVGTSPLNGSLFLSPAAEISRWG